MVGKNVGNCDEGVIVGIEVVGDIVGFNVVGVELTNILGATVGNLVGARVGFKVLGLVVGDFDVNVTVGSEVG